jgi:TetR/AcrR family transcriptional regulator, transcriptional repressor for nem operon
MARPRTFDEETVVDAALGQFRTTGYSGTSLDDLVKATGLAKASIYNAFGDKHTLYIRAFESYCAEVVDMLSRELEGSDETATDRLQGLIRHIADTAGTTSSPPISCFLSKATAELAALDPEVARLAERAFRQIEDVLTKAVSAAQRAGAGAASDDPRSTARHILVALRGLEALAAAGVDRAVLADAARSVSRFTLNAAG